MKVRTSVTLSKDLLDELRAIMSPDASTSAVVEAALREYLAKRRKAARDARDLDIINRNAERLNREAEDALTYQVDL